MKYRKIILGLLWILSLVGISFYGGAISYGFFWALTLVPIISVVYIWVVFLQFRIYQEIESRFVVCKQPVPYYFTLPNESFFAFAKLSVKMYSGTSYVTDLPETESYEMLPGDSDTYHTKLICKYRGEYEVGVKEVEITDFLELFRFRYRVKDSFRAIVFPRLLQLDEIKGLDDFAQFSMWESMQQKEEPDVVTRDYVAGDSVKYIHWKVSAKEQKLKVRNMTGERRKDVLLAYSTERVGKMPEEYLPLENQVLELVLALGNHFVQKKIPCTVLRKQQDMKEFHLEVPGIFDELYQDSGKVNFEKAYSTEKLIQHMDMLKVKENISTYILVTHKLESEWLVLFQEWVNIGIKVLVYWVTDEDVEDYVRQGGGRVRIVRIPVEGNLEEVL